MPWLNAFFLLLVAVFLGWIPVLGPLLLGFLAGRAERGPRALIVLLPALAVQTLGLLATRWIENTLEARNLDGWLWTGVSWLLSPVSTALGRPLGNVIGDSSLGLFLGLFTFPALLGLLLAALTSRK